jgi:hypothetical protein
MGKLSTFYSRLGKTEEALRLLDDALALSLKTGELLDSAELHRRKPRSFLTRRLVTARAKEPNAVCWRPFELRVCRKAGITSCALQLTLVTSGKGKAEADKPARSSPQSMTGTPRASEPTT